ncbi:S8 family peptidase [Porphyromonas somerae]|uniref:S8 family peptidase n=1 Tax=Porphyromonas somerae TaxID=322095 RepID=UPI002A7FF704|nr:S8 family peptidase [Porphyromonas somerae]MDY3884352.1 S8 family peptidase [Porphyromonas somerae]
MTQRPLLFFPSKEVVTRSELPRGKGNYFTPSSTRQGRRLTPRFQQLFNSLNANRVLAQSSVDGIDPEQVLVFETIGSIEEFANAVSKIEGFEWLGEIEIEEILPNDDFYQLNKAGERDDKSLSGRLYLVFTNTKAMSELLSLWNLWINNPNFNCRTGEYRGKSKFKEVFKLLKNIRRWGIQDRFEESNILNLWKEELEIDPNRTIRFEIELWYRSTPGQRDKSYSSVSNLISDIGGRVITVCDLSEIRYHAILAELPASEIENIISDQNTALIKCDNIMYFKPSGQIVMDDDFLQEDLLPIEGVANDAPPTGSPIVAIFDGYPMANHEVLKDRLIIDDPDNMEAYYQVQERKHGTAMCSLIVRGDLNRNEDPLPSPLYVRPIMRPNERDLNRNEYIPNDQLLIDTVHRAVRRMFEGNSSIDAVAPSIKIINISIGDRDRLFYNSMSPWAKLLDWLSYKYRVLFIVSTGNYYNEIHLSISKTEFEAMHQIEKERIFLTEMLNNNRNCRIMSPAETINNLTVGALHIDDATFLPTENRLNPFTTAMPCTYTALGGGYRRAIKPDLVYFGGRQMYDYNFTNPPTLIPSTYKRAPGLKVAAPDNSLKKTIHEIGTSNATALISRCGYYCYEVIEELIRETEVEIPSNMIAILIKAMLVHGCSWGSISSELDRLLVNYNKEELQKVKSRFLGYGFPNIDKVRECTKQRATVIGFNELREGKAHVYSLPLPPSLSSRTVERRLTVTLAWFSPTSPSTQRYRTARLWFESDNQIASSRIDAEWRAVRRGTLQHEVFKGSKASAFIDGESIKIKVNCSKDANSFTDNIPYALLVTLEVAEDIDIEIYQEIKDRISIPITIDHTVVG